MSSAPVLALVGATGEFVSLDLGLRKLNCTSTGLVGGHLLPTFLAALKAGKLSAVRILTSSPDSEKLSPLRSAQGVSIHAISYSNSSSLEQALSGVGILISAMGSSPTKEGSYETNKSNLLASAAAAKVKVGLAFLVLGDVGAGLKLALLISGSFPGVLPLGMGNRPYLRRR